MNKAHRHEKSKARSRKKAALMRLKSWYENTHRQLNNVYRRRGVEFKLLDEQKERRALVKSMTNWQRNQFMKSVKGDTSRATIGMMQDYADMPHWRRRKENNA